MADVLREFLVSLGWKIDEASWKKFTAAVAHTTAVTADLGATTVEAATAIEVAVARVARQYETLYYVSARTGQSAQYIQSTGFAFRQIGLSADDATEAIEGVAAAMRMNPAIAAMFGGAARPQDIVNRLKGSGMPYFMAARLGGMAGINEKTFQHEWVFGDQEAQAEEDHKRRLKEAGINADEAAFRFTQFGRVLNQLEDDFDIMGTRIALDWVNPVEKGVHVLDEAVQWFDRADLATKGWIGTLSSLAVTLTGLFGAEKILSKLLGFGGKTLTGTVAGALLGKGRLLKGGLIGGGVALLQSMKEDDADPGHPLRTMLRNLLGIPDDGGGGDYSPGTPAPYGKSSLGDPRGMLAAVRAAAARNGINPDVMEAVARSEGLAESYAGGDRGTSFGAMQLHRGGRGSVGTEFERQTGLSLDDPANEGAEIDFAAKWVRRYGWGAWAGAKKQGITGMAGVGGGGITVNTTIHVDGSGAPEQVANRVFEKQARVNDNLVRNLLGPHR